MTEHDPASRPDAQSSRPRATPGINAASAGAARGMSRRWHLAETPAEEIVAEMEFALMRVFGGFGHWQSECLAAVCDLPATGPENAMLHIIRMHDRPKSLKDIARLTNRDDVPNIQYSLRKLISAGLVLREGAGRSGVTYQVTDEGRRVCEDYARLRQRNLIAAIEALPGLSGQISGLTQVLNALTGIYEEAARLTATHRAG